MTVAAIVLFTGVMLLNVEKNEQGHWEMATVSSFAQGESGAGGAIYKRSTEPCNYTLKGEYNAKFKILDIIYTVPVSGSLTVTLDKGEIVCKANGDTMCTPRDCPISIKL
ncbi:hypothetical protein [Albibacterium sp.]|uniref:hypothetical protein n=1 Tax=Albibacterium sp. TaxID=2952885 RepID=UPI002BD0247F|nr:hypothetical protein [Albibacterium sp.]HUH18110.1 hypothetical protein [Albibacterium sp.]